MKKCLTFLGAGVIVIAVLCSCLRLRAAYAPEEVSSNSEFEITLVADMENPIDPSKSNEFQDENGGYPLPDGYTCYGFVGLFLPEGWTVDFDAVTYDYIAKDKNDTSGTLSFDETYTGICEALGINYEDKYPLSTGEMASYSWVGLVTDKALGEINTDSIVVKIKVKTNEKYVGEKLPVFVIINESEKLPASMTETSAFNVGEYKETTYSEAVLWFDVVEGTNNIKEVSGEINKLWTAVPVGKGQLLVTLKENIRHEAKAFVFDVQGKVIATEVLSQQVNVLDLNLNKGIYYLAVEKDGILASQAILIK